MIIPKPEDAKHKYQMLRLLRAILLDRELRLALQFKGGSYAALRGLLDRFSVDLDFDLPGKADKKIIRRACYRIFDQLGFKIKDESRDYLQFFLKYKGKLRERNTLKLEINDQPSQENNYEKVLLEEIGLYCQGYTVETMVANKLVAATNRFRKTGKIAGRDYYDLWYFFMNGLRVNEDVVEDLTGMSYVEYLNRLVIFIKTQVSDKLLNQDLNPLLSAKKLNRLVRIIKPELLGLVRDEIKRATL